MTEASLLLLLNLHQFPNCIAGALCTSGHQNNQRGSFRGLFVTTECTLPRRVSHICFTPVNNFPPSAVLCNGHRRKSWKKESAALDRLRWSQQFTKLRVCNLTDTNLFADKVWACWCFFFLSFFSFSFFLFNPRFTSESSVFLLSEVLVWSFTQKNTKQPNATLSRLFPALSERD